MARRGFEDFLGPHSITLRTHKIDPHCVSDALLTLNPQISRTACALSFFMYADQAILTQNERLLHVRALNNSPLHCCEKRSGVRSND